MLRPTRGLRCQRAARSIAAWERRESSPRPGDGNANFGTGEERHVLTVSKTRGEPSASANLKEALCEKIPVYYDLLRNFRRNFGPSTVSRVTVDNLYEGLSGVHTIVRETSEIDSKRGIVYRGLTIPEVIALLPRQGNSPCAEAVFWLLLTGDVPTHQQTASLIADWTARREKRREWWSGPKAETMVSVLRSLPETITPLSRLSIVLTIFNVSQYAKQAKRHAAMPHTYWEYTYEDGMEFLATLPAIVALVAKGQMLTNVSGEGDWVKFLLECLTSPNFDGRKSSVADFLRLYIILNADDNGGVPTVHVTQILGSTDLDISAALASGVLAYADEPKSGTMLQWIELQRKIRKMHGQTWTERALETSLLNLCSRDNLIGHREVEFNDPRYTALLNYAKQYLPNSSEIKLSLDITRVLRLTMNGKNIFPEQSAIAAPIFQSYGLEDMEFNQTLLCMARALGAVASIIWAKVVNAPAEHPMSRCTHSYVKSIEDNSNNRPTRHKMHTRPHK